MTPSITALAVAFGAGATVGALYFTLLWFAVRILVQRPRPFHMLAFYLQALGRIGLVCGGLLLAIILEAPLAEIAMAVTGFIAARFAITAFVRRQDREGV